MSSPGMSRAQQAPHWVLRLRPQRAGETGNPTSHGVCSELEKSPCSHSLVCNAGIPPVNSLLPVVL